MKRLVAAVALLAAAVAVTGWTGYAFDREMNSFEKELNKLIGISDYCTEEDLIDEAENLARQWDKSSGLLRSIVLHSGIDELGRNISSLPRIIEHSGREEMKIRCIEAINLIKNLKLCEKISFENVL